MTPTQSWTWKIGANSRERIRLRFLEPGPCLWQSNAKANFCLLPRSPMQRDMATLARYGPPISHWLDRRLHVSFESRRKQGSRSLLWNSASMQKAGVARTSRGLISLNDGIRWPPYQRRTSVSDTRHVPVWGGNSTCRTIQWPIHRDLAGQLQTQWLGSVVGFPNSKLRFNRD